MSYLLRFLIFSSDAASFRINVDGVFRPDRNSLYVYVYELFLTGKTSLEKVPVSIESIYIHTSSQSVICARIEDFLLKLFTKALSCGRERNI